MSTLWTGNPAEISPLLDASMRVNRSDESTIEIMDHQIPLLLPQRKPDAARLHFLRRLRRLFDELRPYQALYLAGLSILESIIVAKVGKVAGSFYQIFLDQETTALLSTMIYAGFLYGACVATSAAGVWLSGWLSVRWRSHITHLLHTRYCSNIALFTIPSSPLSRIDNPDQRITAETATLCDSLASAARLAAGAPFRVLYYSYIAWQYLGFRGVFTAFVFFIVFAVVQKIAVLPLARAVVVQEKKEGNLRFLHLRLRERGHDVAASRGAVAELHSLDLSLQSALKNQKSVVKWRTAVTAATKGTDYSGALLNYALVAAAVFSGAAAAAGAGGSGGELARFVSNASFASLSLIYSFTEMLDLGEQLSSLAALTARVVGFLEILPPLDDQIHLKKKDENSIGCRNNSTTGIKPTTSSTSATRDQEMRPSGFATMLCPPTSAVFPGSGGGGGSSSIPMELSIHSLGRDLQNEVHGIFPDSFRHQNTATTASINKSETSNNQLLCVITFQFAGNGQIDLSPDRSSPTLNIAAAEMDRLLENYIRWEAAVRSALLAINNSRRKANPLRESNVQENGTTFEQNREEIQNNSTEAEIWCDSVDPRTGLPLHGTPSSSSSSSNQRWSEVAAARTLLHYDRRDAGVCPLVVHPVYGTSAYPVSFFTNASVEVLFEALSSLADSTDSGLSSPLCTSRNFSGISASPASSTSSCLLSCRDLSFSTPDGRKPLVSNLSFSLSRGQWLMISGPNGAGKSTLLRVLSGLHSPTAGTVVYNNDVSGNDDLFADPTVAMLLPQRPLSAPGPALWQQIAYPGTTRPADHVLGSILNDVGLGYLVEQTGGNFDATGPCSLLLDTNYENEIDHSRTCSIYNSSELSINTNTGVIDGTRNSGGGGGGGGLYFSSCLSQEDEEMLEKWSSTLSPGEFQRIALARLLFHRPQVALLDEPCSAMDDTSAKKLLGLVRAAGVTCITVAQDTAMYREVHAVHLKLKLSEDGSGFEILENNLQQ
ncbi:putative Lysosomal cobalamin transporter ABCD4 [Nannochloris sp. 'desiccata']|nr:hypothetical protein KSW81_005677 [Chlorella desiccata (nom. nud.)]KAH7623417.1 putative Lysosomal cobalamin transporter ABCD4 [Chlorella desiccata (nom. nud.)]